MALDPNKTYQIKGSLLITLLATAGIFGGGVTALFASGDLANAKSIEHEEMIEMDLGPAAGATLDGFLEAQVCPKIDTAFALPEGTCNSALLDTQASSVTLHKRDTDDDGMRDTWKLSRQIVRDGQAVFTD